MGQTNFADHHWPDFSLATMVIGLGDVLGAVNPDTTRFMEIRLEELQTKKSQMPN